MLKEGDHVPLERWGKDHYSLLAYVECRAVDDEGILDYRHMRVNENRHTPIGRPYMQDCKWCPDYGTRLKNFFVPDAHDHLEWHDDFDCLEDMEREGFVQTGTVGSKFVALTEKGMALAAELRAWKAGGGNFAKFALRTRD
jgi:hypothetical protein